MSSLQDIANEIDKDCAKQPDHTIVIKEPNYISNSQSTRQGYVRAVNDMQRVLKAEFSQT